MFLCDKYVILTLSQCCFYSCAGVADSPLRRVGMRQHPRLLRRCFMPGKSPPCRILTLVAKNCKSFLFREKKDLRPPEIDRKRRERGKTSPSRQNANVGHFWTNVEYKKEETDNSCRSKRGQEKRGFAACRKMRATHYGPQAVFQGGRKASSKSRMGHGMGQRQG